MADPPSGGSWSEENDALAREHGHESWEAWIEKEEERLGRPICGGRRTTKPGPCGYPPGRRTGHPGKGRCSRHGGSSPRGMEHYNAKDGRTSIYASPGTPLGESARTFLESTQQLEDLSQELAIMRARMRMLVQLSEQGPITAKEVLGTLGELKGAIRSGDAPKVRDFLEQIEEDLETAVSDAEAFEEFASLAEQVRKLVESSVKITERQLQPVNEVRVYVVISKLSEIILDYVQPGKKITKTDRNEVVRQLERLSNDYRPSRN